MINGKTVSIVRVISERFSCFALPHVCFWSRANNGAFSDDEAARGLVKAARVLVRYLASCTQKTCQLDSFDAGAYEVAKG